MANLDYQYIAELVDRAKAGDSDAFAELYLATYQRQYRFACIYLRNSDMAQDALQDTYVSVLKNLASLADSGLFISWLNQITFRICFNMQKKQRRYHEEMNNFEELQYTLLPHREVDPEEYVVRIDQKDFIIRQVLSLPFTESQIIILRYYNNLTIKAIASLMEMSQSSVKRYLNKGRRKLEALLDTAERR